LPHDDPRDLGQRPPHRHGAEGHRAAPRLQGVPLVLARSEAPLRARAPAARAGAGRARRRPGGADHARARLRRTRRPARAHPVPRRGTHVSRSEPAVSSRDDRERGGPGPLAGVRMIELGMLLAGPFAGRLLGDMGADVIKVEPPGKRDPLRDWGLARYQERSLWWPVQSRNKRCITLNLREAKGQELLLELVKVADVVSENFRPGTLERWNLGYDRLAEANRGIILARVSGYGQTGPYSGRAGFASVAEAMGGLRYLNGFPGEPPPRTGISLGDSLAAMFATQGILAALYERDVLGDGRGQEIDVSLVEAS